MLSLVLIFLLFVPGRAQAGIQFFGKIDRAMSNQQTVLNLKAYIKDMGDSIPENNLPLNFNWHNFKRDVNDGNWKMARFWLNEINRITSMEHTKFRHIFLEYHGAIDYCLNDLMDNAMGASVVASSVPMGRTR